MRKSGQFSIKSFPLKKCFDSDTILVIFMPEKVNSYALMAFDYLGFIASCFGFSIISNSNNFFFLNLLYSHSHFFFPVCPVQKVLYLELLQTCSVFCHSVALPLVSLDAWGSMDFSRFVQQWDSAFVNLTVGKNTSQPASCFVNVDSKNNLLYCVILILSLTTLQAKYYIFHNSLIEFVLFLPVSLFPLSTEQVLFFIFDSLLTGASSAACWAKYQEY